MKKIYCLLLFVVCSQAYGQIHLDSATYYSLIMKGEWIEEGAKLDSTIVDELVKLKIDSNYYWCPDSQITIVMRGLSYDLNIQPTMFVLRVKRQCTSPGMKPYFYLYGWFIDSSTLYVVNSYDRVKFSKIKKKTPTIYKNSSF